MVYLEKFAATIRATAREGGNRINTYGAEMPTLRRQFAEFGPVGQGTNFRKLRSSWPMAETAMPGEDEMTVVVAMTDGERLVFGADSAATNLTTGEIYTLNNQKVFRCGAWLIGHTLSYHLGQVLRWRVAWPEPPASRDDLDAFVAVQVVDALQEGMRSAGVRNLPDNEPRDTILFGTAGRLFALSDDDSVAYLHHPFAAIGHGRHIAYGAMQILQGLDLPLEAKCRAALDAAEKFDATVRSPFLLIGD